MVRVEVDNLKHCEQRRLAAEGPAANLNIEKPADVVARGRDMVCGVCESKMLNDFRVAIEGWRL